MITAEELEKLFELKEKGIITEEEFNQKRDEYLSDDNTCLTQRIKPINKVWFQLYILPLIISLLIKASIRM